MAGNSKIIMTSKNDVPAMLLASVVVVALIFLSYSKYFVKSDLEVRLLNQTSSCYTGETLSSGAGWSNGNIIMTSAFETPDPCYWVSSIKAYQQGDRLWVTIKTSHLGVCVQCFGLRRVDYEILSPEAEKNLDIYIEIEGLTKQYAKLSLAA
jgi:hypothetical protein